MVARATNFVGPVRGASSAGVKIVVEHAGPWSASRTSGDITGWPGRHSGSALPESMTSLSDNGRAGHLFHGVRISGTHPRQRAVFAGRHVIIGFQLEIFNSLPERKDSVRQQSRYLSGLSFVFLRFICASTPVFPTRARASGPILRSGQVHLSLAGPSPASCQVPVRML